MGPAESGARVRSNIGADPSSISGNGYKRMKGTIPFRYFADNYEEGRCLLLVDVVGFSDLGANRFRSGEGFAFRDCERFGAGENIKGRGGER